MSAPGSASARSLELKGEGVLLEEPTVTLFGTLEIEDSELRWLSNSMIVERLVESGVSRLSAERIVEVQRGDDEPGRARRHGQSHR